MGITRADISGALKLLSANNIADRKKYLRAMLGEEHSPKDVSKAISDLESYPEWGQRVDLDAAVISDASAIPPAKKKGSK